MDDPLHILILDDSPAYAELMLAEVRKEGYAATWRRVESESAFIGDIEEIQPDIILAEYSLTTLGGRRALALARNMCPDVPFIFVTRYAGTEKIIELLREGATDYVSKDRLERLGSSVRRALRESELMEERKWAEVELFRSEERFRAIIENASDLIVIIDAHGLITYVTPSVKRILGYDPEEVTGRPVFDYFHPEERDETVAVLREILANPGTTPSLAFRVLHKGGKWLFLEGDANNLLDNLIVSGIVITSRDVTDRVLQARNLQKLNQCFLSLGSQSSENTRTVVETCKEILQATIAKYSKLGKEGILTMSSKPGEKDFSLVREYERLPCYRVIREEAEGPLFIEDLRSTEYAAVYPDIIRFGLKSFLGFPVKLEGKTVGCLSLFDKHKRSYSVEEIETMATLAQTVAIEEERLQREERLREFIDIASHELRHPIALVSGYARYLKEDGEALDGDRRDHILEVVYRGADRLDYLAGELLDVSRIERGEFGAARQAVELEPLVRQAVQEEREKGFAHRFLVKVDPHAGLVMADGEQLLRALLALLDNACHNSPETSQVRVEAGAADGEVVVSVKDRGCGVPEEHQESIFERFHQVEESIHHSQPGIGLGLYITRDIIRQHGGRIWYEPRPGGGSTFRFTLEPAPGA